MFRLLTIVLIVLIGNSDGRLVKTIPISNANNWLTVRLLQELGNQEIIDERKGNVFFSPLSISTALGALVTGSKDTTNEELKEVLGYNFGHISNENIREEFERVFKDIEDIDKNKFHIHFANKVVVQKSFEISHTFIEDLKKYFQTDVESKDFLLDSKATTDDINEWVKHQTNRKIENLLSQPLSPSTRLVLLNAFYFEGIWKTKFVKSETHEEVFFNNGTNEKKTQMMRRLGKFNFTEMPELDSNLLELPYSGEDISLYIVLPNQRQGLLKFRTNLRDFEMIEKSITELREVNADVVIPKLKIEITHSLKNHLMALGMRQVFTSEADLSGIDGKKDLHVSEVIHKSVIEVTEEGNEAADVPHKVVGVMSNAPQMETFRADHPFLFFIRDNRNGMILFCGHLNNM
jgi:serpin B